MSHCSRAGASLALLIAVTAACAVDAPTGTGLLFDRAMLATGPAPGSPVSLLSANEHSLFLRGKAVFATNFTPETGLGPLFNATGCAECHEDPVVGAVGDEVELHATAYHSGASPACDDLSATGGFVIQQHVTPALQAALGIDAEPVPAAATATGHRTTPSILGFGLLDAVPEAEILALADAQASGSDGISGRPNRDADGHVGRFGRKAQVSNLRAFTAGAFVMEMGITNPESPTEQTVGGNPLPAGVDPTPEPELSAADLDAADAFVRFLAAPSPVGSALGQARGQRIFTQVGCATCHVPALTTGANPVHALSNRIVPAFTDLLLHDMGPDLADICLGLADTAEFRTEPLMGLRFVSAFLHDGRATTIEQAVTLHAGEAAPARDRFLALSDRERGILLKFLGNL